MPHILKKKGYKSPSINIYNEKKIEIISDKILKDKNSKIYFKNTEYKINSKNSSILKEIYN